MSDPAAQSFAWQGWRLELPAAWNPLKLTGTFDTGQVLFADHAGPRLGMRWRKLRMSGNDEGLFRRLIGAELGTCRSREAGPISTQRAGSKAGEGLLSLDPDPPGKDMYVCRAPSGRILQLVYHASERDDVMESRVIANLNENALEPWHPWEVFSLSCRAPRGYQLASHALHAGDLSLNFVDGQGQILDIRQVSPARLALGREPMKQWLATWAGELHRQFKLVSETPADDEVGSWPALRMDLSRRRRFVLARRLPRKIVALAAHDVDRDRLLLVRGSDEAVVRQAMEMLALSGARATIEPGSSGDRMLDSRPKRSPGATLESIDGSPTKWRVTAGASPPGRLANLLGAPASSRRSFELDELGKFVWDACDGRASVAGIVERLARDYSLHPREAELATIQFLRMLARRRLIHLKAAPPADD